MKVIVIIVDVAEGVDLDYSTFSIIDITSVPYQQVACYRSNKIDVHIFPEIINTFIQIAREVRSGLK